MLCAVQHILDITNQTRSRPCLLYTSLLPGCLIGHIHNIAAGSFQLVQNLVLGSLRQLRVECLGIRTGLHDGSLLVLGQLAPSVVGDDSLDSAQGVAVEDQVVCNLGERVGLVVCDEMCIRDRSGPGPAPSYRTRWTDQRHKRWGNAGRSLQRS